MIKLSNFFNVMLVVSIILILANLGFAQTPAPTPILPHQDCPLNRNNSGAIIPPDPCGLLADLHWAMNNLSGAAPHPRWEERVNFGYGAWQNPNGGSENWSVIANTIALWKPSTSMPLAQNIQWWHKFLDCQNGGGPNCTFAAGENPGRLIYIKGTELLSDTYDAQVVTAIAAVNFWAVTHPQYLSLSAKAKKYLRATWAMYTLAAGKTSARTYDSYNDTAQPPQSDICQLAANGSDFYTGPFIAAAGMRSKPSSACQDNRGPLLLRATEKTGVVNKREMKEQVAVATYIQQYRSGDSRDENVYGLVATERTALKAHIDNGTNTSVLVNLLGNVRTSVTYHFLGWREANNHQVRATVMETNLNSFTSAIYASKYSSSTRKAEFLFPWSGAIRNGITRGYGRLFPDIFNPNRVQASNIDLSIGEQENGYHGTRIVEMALPSAQSYYHVMLYSGRSAECIACQ